MQDSGQQQNISRREYSVGDVLDCVAECVQSLIHSILYYRGVYPATSFEKRQLYGLVVPCHRHPKVVDYISKAVEQMRHVLLEEGRVDVRIPIIDDEGEEMKIYEMYRFIFSRDAGKDGVSWYTMYDDVRAAVLRLQAVSSSDMMEHVSERRVSFRIQICAHNARDLLDTWMVVGRGEPLNNGRVIPLQSVCLPQASSGGPCQMACMIHVFTTVEEERVTH